MKHTLKFFKKIIQFPQNSLLRQCFESSKRYSQKTNSGVKANWYNILVQKLDIWQCKHVLDDIPEFYNLDGCSQKMLQINQYIRKIYKLSLENDILKMQHSTSMPIYKMLYTHINSQEFLNADISWSFTRVTVQCRANMSQFTCCKTIKLAVLRNFYDNSVDPSCTSCTSGESEDLIHILFKCTKYNEIRSKFMNIVYSNNINIRKYLSKPNETTMKNMYLFLKHVADSQNC